MLAPHIRASAKLREHDTHGLRRKCEAMLRLSIKEAMQFYAFPETAPPQHGLGEVFLA
ncbi:MAG TPA: hypothetical protein VGO47_12210 [Chlamydiales bacterium]|nr:hypothetical protein [Chlamydiales bacterium]